MTGFGVTGFVFRLVVIVWCCVAAGCGRGHAGVVARGGVLDLRGVDLSREVVDLAGPWERVPGLVSPADFDRAGVKDSVSLPAFWRKALPERTATLRLRVILPQKVPQDLVLATNQEISAYTLWLDGQPLMRRGVPSGGRTGETLQVGWREAQVGAGPAVRELVVQVSNFHHGRQGHLTAIRLGERARIRSQVALRMMPYMACLGVLLAFGVHYLLILWPLVRDRQYLYFGLFCATRFSTGLLSNVDVPFASFFGFDISEGPRLVVGWLGIAVSIWSVGLFAESLFPDRLQRFLNRLQIAVVAFGACWFLVAPFPTWNGVATVVVWFGFLQVLFLCRLVALALVRRRTSAVTFAIGYLVMFVLSVHAALYLMGVADGHIFLTEGSVALAFAEATALSQRIGSALRTKRELLEEVREQNRELERLSRVKDDFLANTSHELRTPLHAIQGLTQAVLSDTRTSLDEHSRRSLDLVRGSARRLGVLVEDLLVSADLRHREFVLRPSTVDLTRLVSETLDGFRLQALSKGVGLELEVVEPVSQARVDPDRVVQVLVNLVANALRFTDAGGVTVRIRQREDRIAVEVQDTGIGIGPREAERIFERFEQGDLRRGGTGLGLSISRDLVRLHGGDLTVESVPGKGCVFRFDLPSAIAESGERAQAAESDTLRLVASTGASGLKVLAVDDEPTNLRIVKAFLEPQGIGVVPLLDGGVLMECIEEHRPDLVLLDVMLPGADGFELCRAIRARWKSDQLPVLFLTARTAPEDIEAGYAAGGDDYVAKPFLRDELLARVGALLRHREANRKLGDEEFRTRMCKLLVRSLEVWSETTGRSKADLAEESGLWNIQMDRNGWRRTTTLDRYLEVSKLPRLPKWGPVLRTARYVANLKEAGEEGRKLSEEARVLEAMAGRLTA